jgi:hypothetical protein
MKQDTAVSRERGSLMLIVICMLLLASSVIAAWLSATITESRQVARKSLHTSAFYLAEAGAEHAKEYLSTQARLGSSIVRTAGTIPASTVLGASTVSMGDGYYTAQIQVALGQWGTLVYTITSVGSADPDGVQGDGDEISRKIAVKALLGSFARYAYYTNSEGTNIWFISLDVLRGLVHSNSGFRIAGIPDFWGKLTSTSSTFTFYNGGSTRTTSNPSNPPQDIPNFRDGYKLSAPNVPYPTSTTEMEEAAEGDLGLIIDCDTEITLGVEAGVGHMTYTTQEEQQVWHEPVTETHGWRRWHCSIYHSYYYSQTHTHPGQWVTEEVTVTHDATVYDGETNPTGIAIVQVNGDAELHGTLAGQLTILTQNNIVVTNDVLYNVDPMDYDGDGLMSDADGDGTNDPAADRTGDGDTNDPGEAADDTDDDGNGVQDAVGYDQPESTDTLGLVAKGNVIVADDGGPAINRKICAAIMAIGMDGQEGKFTVEDYANHLEGTLTLEGSLVQKQRGAVGTFSGNMYGLTKTSGFSKNYNYDRRLLFFPPPYFPPVIMLDLIYWQELPL